MATAYLKRSKRMWLFQRRAVWLAAVIVLATVITFAVLGFHIYAGETYELRTLVWLAITLVAEKSLRYTGIYHV